MNIHPVYNTLIAQVRSANRSVLPYNNTLFSEYVQPITRILASSEMVAGETITEPGSHRNESTSMSNNNTSEESENLEEQH